MRLGVNIDHVATLRQARLSTFPDPIDAALYCERAGADSIVCHLREDRRHIQDKDARRLKEKLHIPLNLEMSIADEIVLFALKLKPKQVTLVPEKRRELTTEGGLDVVSLRTKLKAIIGRFDEKGILVSFFIDPSPHQIEASVKIGARIVELHTGCYSNACSDAIRKKELLLLKKAALQANKAGLVVAAGHGLDYSNVRPIVRLPHVEELNIGFSIIGRSVFVGMEKAVRDMKSLLKN